VDGKPISEAARLDTHSLAGVSSRDALLDMLFRETDRVQRIKTPLSLIVFKLDETACFGSREAISVLGELAERMQRLLRSYDIFGRIAEITFALGLPGCALANAVSLAHRIRAEVFSMPYRVSGASLQLTASFGVAPSLGRSPLIVLREAIQAMQSATCTGSGEIQASRLSPPLQRPAESQPAPDTKSRLAG
jgi:diguanylate cyclase (GGDEF)-like protein